MAKTSERARRELLRRIRLDLKKLDRLFRAKRRVAGREDDDDDDEPDEEEDDE